MNDQAKTLGSIAGAGSAAQCSQSTWPNKIQPHMAHQVAMTAAEAAARAQKFPSENIGTHVAQAYLQAYEAVEGWTKPAPQLESPPKEPGTDPSDPSHPDYYAHMAEILKPYEGTIGTCGFYAAKAAALQPKDA